MNPLHVISSKWADITIPEVSIVDFLFEKLTQNAHLDSFIDAHDSNRKYTFGQLHKLILQVLY